MSDTPMHSVSVASIVVGERERVLLIRRRDNGRWEPPGGVLELGETFAVRVADAFTDGCQVRGHDGHALS
jgi:8-oxo-dGTP pyrophosphatase MutT (NUDIX family)